MLVRASYGSHGGKTKYSSQRTERRQSGYRDAVRGWVLERLYFRDWKDHYLTSLYHSSRNPLRARITDNTARANQSERTHDHFDALVLETDIAENCWQQITSTAVSRHRPDEVATVDAGGSRRQRVGDKSSEHRIWRERLGGCWRCFSNNVSLLCVLLFPAVASPAARNMLLLCFYHVAFDFPFVFNHQRSNGRAIVTVELLLYSSRSRY